MTTLNNIGSGFNRAVINDNFDTIEDEFNDNVLRRDGVTQGQDNSMKVDLDMNSNRILNLPAPQSLSEPLRKADVPNYVLEAGNVIITDTTETITLTSGQSTVIFVSNTTTKAKYYMSGDNSDRGLLLEVEDYSVTNLTTIELASTFPAGSKISNTQVIGAEVI